MIEIFIYQNIRTVTQVLRNFNLYNDWSRDVSKIYFEIFGNGTKIIKKWAEAKIFRTKNFEYPGLEIEKEMSTLSYKEIKIASMKWLDRILNLNDLTIFSNSY